MKWNVEKENKGINSSYSVIKILLREGKINKNFLSTLDDVSLEDLVAIKLELAAKAAGGYLYGIPILDNMYRITREGAYKFALSCTRTKAEAARVLGKSVEDFESILKKIELKKKIYEDSS